MSEECEHSIVRAASGENLGSMDPNFGGGISLEESPNGLRLASLHVADLRRLPNCEAILHMRGRSTKVAVIIHRM